MNLEKAKELGLTAEYIRLRGVECGECLEWPNAPSGQGGLYIRFKQHCFAVRKTLWELENDKPAPEGRRITYACDNPKCIHHVKQATISAINKRTHKSGKRPTASVSAKIAAARRKSAKLSPEAVADIKARAESAATLAKRHGVSQTSIYAVWGGKLHRDYSGPFSGLVR